LEGYGSRFVSWLSWNVVKAINAVRRALGMTEI
jgi:hypothetical protein